MTPDRRDLDLYVAIWDERTAIGGAIGDAYGIRFIYYVGGSLLLLAALCGIGVIRRRAVHEL